MASAETAPGPSTSVHPRRQSQLRVVARSFAKDRAGVVALIVFCCLVVYAFLVPLLADPEATRVKPAEKLQPPGLFGGGDYLLGTDHLGRELSVLVAQGLRTSLIIGVAVVLICALLGWFIGALGGYLGTWVDQAVGRFMDIINIFPGVLIAVAIVSAVGGSIGVMILVLCIQGIVIFGRLGRTIALSNRNAEYALACRLFGGSQFRVIVDHIGRVSLPPVLSLALVQLPQVILLEASLSFVGYGVQPPNTSIGLIVSSERNFLAVQPWPIIFAGLVLAVTCVSLALIGLAGRNALSGTPARSLKVKVRRAR